MPRRKSGLNTGIRLAPPPVGNDDHPHLNVADLYIGCIVWLPPRDPLQAGIKCDKANCCDNKELEDKGYNHPIIVLSIKQRDGSNVVGDLICCVACVTSYSNTTLLEYLKTRPRKKNLQRSIPIKDPEVIKYIELDGITSLEELQLEKKNRLLKQSYVRLDHTFEVPASMMRQYGYRKSPAYKMRLTDSSYATLIEKLNMTAQDYQSTETLRRIGQKRISALANPPEGLVETISNPQFRPVAMPSEPRPHRQPLVPYMQPASSQTWLQNSVQSENNFSNYSYQYTPPDYGTQDPERTESGILGWLFVGCTIGFVIVGLVMTIWAS